MSIWFVTHWEPWFRRGTNFYYGVGAGVFTFGQDNGRIRAWISFRVVTYYVRSRENINRKKFKIQYNIENKFLFFRK